MCIDRPAAAVHTDLPFPPSELPGADPASCKGHGSCTSGRICPLGEKQQIGAGRGQGGPSRVWSSGAACSTHWCLQGCTVPGAAAVCLWGPPSPGWLSRFLSRYPVSLPLPSCKGQPDLLPGYAQGMLWGGECWEETVKPEMPRCFPTR